VYARRSATGSGRSVAIVQPCAAALNAVVLEFQAEATFGGRVTEDTYRQCEGEGDEARGARRIKCPRTARTATPTPATRAS